MAQLPNVYSLLGQATTDQYRRERREREKYYKDLEKDRMRAMLLQPLIGAVATTGMQALTDFVGDRLLPERGSSFLNTEKGRALGVQLSSIDQQKKQVQKELDFYNTPDASTKMADIIYNEAVAKIGDITESDKSQLKSMIYGDKDLVANELNTYRENLKNQLTFLNTAPSREQIASRLKDTRFYYGKNKLQRLFSTGFNKLLGKDMDEVRQRSRNFLITGSEDPEYKSAIFDYLQNSKTFQELEKYSDNIIKGDDDLVKNAISRLRTADDSKELWAAIEARHGRRAEEQLIGHAFFSGIEEKYGAAQEIAKETGTVNKYANTLGFRAFNSPEWREYQDKNDFKGAKNFVLKQFFGGPNGDQTFDDFRKSAEASSSTIAEALDNLYESLESFDPKIAEKVKGQKAYTDPLVEGAFKEAENLMYILSFENSQITNFSATEVKKGIQNYVAKRLEDPNVNKKLEYRPLTLSEKSDEEKQQLLQDSIAQVREDKVIQEELAIKADTIKTKLTQKMDQIITTVQDDDSIDAVNKHRVASDQLKKIIDDFELNVKQGILDQDDFSIFQDQVVAAQQTINDAFTVSLTPGRKRKPSVRKDLFSDVTDFAKDVWQDFTFFPKPTGYTQRKRRSLLAPEEQVDYSMPVDDIIQNTVAATNLKNVDQSFIKTVADIETSSSLSTKERSKAGSKKDAYGIMQIQTATATQPGYGVDDIFTMAKNAGISYDTDLETTAKDQIKAGQKKVTGAAGREVTRLLAIPSLNIAFGSTYLDAFMTKWKGDKVNTIIAYSAGPGAVDEFNKYNRDRSILPRETQNYLKKAGV